MKDALLISPPYFRELLDGPHIAVPLLASHLRRNDVTVDTLDLNIRFIRRLLSKETLAEKLRGFDEQIHQTYHRLKTGQALDPGTKIQFRQILEITHSLSPLHKNYARFLRNRRLQSIYLYTLTSDPCWNMEPTPDLVEKVKRGEYPKTAYDPSIEEEFLPRLRRQAYRAIGFSLSVTAQWLPTLLMLYRLREAGIKSFTVLGGTALNGLTYQDQEALFKLIPADGLVRYAGEQPLVALTKALRESRPLREVPSLVYKDDGHIRSNANGAPVSLNAPTPPDFSLITQKKLYRPPLTLPIIYAQGCYWGRCAFCNIGTMMAEGHHFAARDPENFFNELSYFYKHHGQKHFQFIGDSLPPAFAARVCTLIIKHRYKIHWGCYIRITKAWTDDILGLLARSGCRKLLIGIESMSDNVLKKMRKGLTSDMALPFVKRLHRLGIKCSLSFIWDLPGTTYHDAEKTLRQVRQLAKYADMLHISPYGINFQSDIGRRPEAYGFQFVSKPVFRSHYNIHTGETPRPSNDSVADAFASQTLGLHRSVISYGLIDTHGMSAEQRKKLFPKFKELEWRVNSRSTWIQE